VFGVDGGLLVESSLFEGRLLVCQLLPTARKRPVAPILLRWDVAFGDFVQPKESREVCDVLPDVLLFLVNATMSVAVGSPEVYRTRTGEALAWRAHPC
jgi:hypothetical protein